VGRRVRRLVKPQAPEATSFIKQSKKAQVKDQEDIANSLKYRKQ
jgi:hypothetical protein